MSSTEQQIDNAVAKRHVQNTDTAAGAQSADLDMNLHKIIGLADPTGDKDAANKEYVDGGAGGGGDVNGPGSSVGNAIVLFDGVTGKLIKDSARLILDVMAGTGNNIPDEAAIKTYGDTHWCEGSGDVSGPATNTDSYIPQWNGADSKLLKNGFAITAAGKALIDDADAPAQRVTLGLLSAALRDAEDAMTDGANLPDGHAIKTYGDANWGGGYTNLTEFIAQTAFRVFYSNTDGDVTELALGADGTYLKSNGPAVNPSFGVPGGGGDVVGPASATDNAICLFDGATGNLIQNSLTTIDAAGAPTLPNDTAIRWKDTGGIQRNVIAYDIVNNIIIGVDGDDAKVYIERLDTSSAGAPLQSSRRFSIVSNYWKTAAEHQRMATLYHEIQSDAPKSTLHFDMGEDGAEVEMFALENDNGTRLAIVKNLLKIEGGNPGAGKTLVSDANGLASWETVGGSSKWTDGGTYIYGTVESGNTRLHDSGLLELSETGGTSPPILGANRWGYSTSVTEAGRRLQILDGTEDHTSTPAVWLEKLYSSNGAPAGDPTIPVCFYAGHKHTGTGTGFTHTIMSYAENAGTGNNDTIAISGRARKTGNGIGDACGVWGSAYNDIDQDGGIMALEAAIYQNAIGMIAGDRLMDKWSCGLHVSGISTGSPAKAGIAVDAAGTHRFWNAMIIDKECFAGTGTTGTVGINMGSCDASQYPQHGIKFGIAGTHLYCNSGDLKFYDPNTGAKTLAELAAGGGSSKWTDVGAYIHPTAAGNVFRIYDDDRLWHKVGSIDPFLPPYQEGPLLMGHATAGSYAHNQNTYGNIYHLSSWVENTGTSPIVGVFGYAIAKGDGAQGWGGNFGSYATVAGARAHGVEINYGELAAGADGSYGCVINPCGDYETTAYIQIQAANINCRSSNGIVFNGNAFGAVADSGALITTLGTNNPAIGVDFSLATFSDCVFRVGSSATPHLACTSGDLRFYDPVTGAKTLAELAAGGGGGLNNVVEDLTPQLGGYLDLNEQMIMGNGIIGLNNTYGYYCKNTSGDYRKGVCLNSSNDWEFGLDAHMLAFGYGCSDANPMMIRVGGVNNKQIVVGTVDSGGSGYRMLRVTN